MIRRPPRSTLDRSSAASDVYKRQVQRDVRSVLNVRELDVFSTFMRLVAGRTAQEQNLSDLSADAGVSLSNVRPWLSVLELSLIHISEPTRPY